MTSKSIGGISKASVLDTANLRLQLPLTIHAMVGIPIQIVWENIWITQTPETYSFALSGDNGIGAQDSTHWSLTPEQGHAGNYTLHFTADGYGRRWEGSCELEIQSPPLGTESLKLLVVGDSITDTTLATAYINRLAAHMTAGGINWTLLGPVHESNWDTGVNCQAQGGKTFYFYSGDTIDSPFFHSGALDIEYYLSNTLAGEDPDLVLFLLGANDVAFVDPDSATAMTDKIALSLDGATTIIDAFKAQLPACKFGIAHMLPPNILQAPFTTAYGADGPPTRWGYRRNQQRFILGEQDYFAHREDELIYLGAPQVNVDPVAGFPSNDPIHPNATGHQQLADSLYSFIRSLI